MIRQLTHWIEGWWFLLKANQFSPVVWLILNRANSGNNNVHGSAAKEEKWEKEWKKTWSQVHGLGRAICETWVVTMEAARQECLKSQSGSDLFCNWGMTFSYRGPKTESGQCSKNQVNGIEENGQVDMRKGEGLLERALVYYLLSSNPSSFLLGFSLGQFQDLTLTLVFVVLKVCKSSPTKPQSCLAVCLGEKGLRHEVSICIYAYLLPCLHFIISSTTFPAPKLWCSWSSWLIPLHLLSTCLSLLPRSGNWDLLIY